MKKTGISSTISALALILVVYAARVSSHAKKLGDDCKHFTDCIDILHAICEAGTCVCRQKNVRVSDYVCAPLLGEFCWKNETCATENSVCIERECECRPGFVPESHQCLPELLGQPCKNDAACSSVENAKCSEQKVCFCSGNRVAISRRLCTSLIGETCQSDSECGVERSACINQKCVCQVGLFASSPNECRDPYLGMQCENSANCTEFISNSICFAGMCACSEGYKAWQGNLCQTSFLSLCFSDASCVAANTACIANVCRCKPGYVMRNEKCLSSKRPRSQPDILGTGCVTDSDCSQVELAVCWKGQCTCARGFYSVNATACAKALGEFCVFDRDCTVRFSHCYQKVCQCQTGHIQYSKNECKPTELGSFCLNDNSCSLIINAQCLEGQCSCKENHVEASVDACAPLLNSTCSSVQQCAAKNSVCINHRCQCEFNYFQQSSYECVLWYLEQWCYEDFHCITIPYSKCSDAGKCVCDENYKRVDSRKCAPILGGACIQNADCITDNAVCSSNQCKCAADYAQRSENMCLPVSLGQTCQNHQDCDKISNAQCSEDLKCDCKPGYIKFDRRVCLPLLGGSCTDHKDCYVYNSNCIDGTCQCLQTFVRLSSTQCVAAALTNVCYTDEDCDVLNSKCSRFNFCVCKKNFISVNAQSCASIIRGPCSYDADCNTPNSHCIDKTCQCKPMFIDGGFNNCLPMELAEFCEIDSDCVAIKNSRCYENECTCKKSYIKSNSTTCLALLGAECSRNSECSVKDSVCIDSRCQCNPPSFVQVGYSCASVSLGNPCKDDSHCQNIPNAICIDNVCKCGLDTFALNNRTCTKYLNTTCTTSDDCGVQSSDCVDNLCQCMPGWAAITDMACVRRSALFYCDNQLDCGEHWHSACVNNHCVCKSNYLAVNALSCMPILMGNCWRDDQCMTEHSECFDFRCQCKQDFVDVANNLCVAKKSF